MRPRSAGAALLLAAIAAIGSLAVAEIGLRSYAAIADSELARSLRRRDPLETLHVPHGQYGYRQRPNAVITYPNGSVATSNAMGFRGPAVDLEKPPRTFRIVLLGGSATHGWGVDDDETIDAYMRDAFARDPIGPHVEVVNLALDGYDSAQAFERMRSDGVALEPDLVIVNSGINDVRNARIPDLRAHPDPRTSIWERAMAQMREELRSGGPAPWTLTKHYLFLARFPGIYRDFADARRAAAAPVAAARIAPNDEAVDYFEQSLIKIWQLTERVGGAMLLSTPPSALLALHAPDETSYIGYWVGDAATTADYRRRMSRRMEEVARRLSARGHPVRHVAHELPSELFLDDCHLTPAGNRALGSAFAADARGFIARDGSNAAAR